MSAPDFYFAINAMFKHIHDRFGKASLVDYWQKLGTHYYAQRWQAWKSGGLNAIAADWRTYFDKEPGADVVVTTQHDRVILDVHTCPAIAHIRKHNRDLADYFCEHCDVINTAMTDHSGHRFTRTGGMGSCQQQFIQLTTSASPSATPSAASPSKAEK